MRPLFAAVLPARAQGTLPTQAIFCNRTGIGVAAFIAAAKANIKASKICTIHRVTCHALVGRAAAGEKVLLLIVPPEIRRKCVPSNLLPGIHLNI
jgi:hypothetical protein